jgi:hypothetical protein
LKHIRARAIGEHIGGARRRASGSATAELTRRGRRDAREGDATSVFFEKRIGS